MRRWRAVFETFLTAADDESATSVTKRIGLPLGRRNTTRLLFVEPADEPEKRRPAGPVREVSMLRARVRELEEELAEWERLAAAVDGR